MVGPDPWDTIGALASWPLFGEFGSLGMVVCHLYLSSVPPLPTMLSTKMHLGNSGKDLQVLMISKLTFMEHQGLC